jgi:hypothetical protein
MENFFNQLLTDWEFSSHAPGLWSALSPIAPYIIAVLAFLCVCMLARILLHRTVRERLWLRFGVGLFLFNMVYGVLVPAAGITQPITIRNLVGSCTLTFFLWCISRLFFGLHPRMHKQET